MTEPATTTELAPVPETPAGRMQVNLFGTDNPAETIARAKRYATALAAELEPTAERPTPLYTQIRDRRHVLVEGWTLLGSMLGIFPVEVWTRKVTDESGEWAEPTMKTVTVTRDDGSSYERTVLDRPGRGGWEARVEARTIDGQVVGAAEMECRWSESSWETRDSYALRSMAQTRAASKALRMPLGFIVQLAGFDATPAEEMIGIRDAARQETSSYQCPSCGSPVYDNRADIEAGKRGEKYPRFKCSSRTCTGGSDGRPWVTWDPHFFDEPDYTNKAKAEILNIVAKAFPELPAAEQKQIALDFWIDAGGQQYDSGDTPMPYSEAEELIQAALDQLPPAGEPGDEQ